ncbi:hypothetical protein POM88_009540 [Heracleum sosnowskyi]|uniref:NPH3 domain-containing protein n=1 Tax=Heracleum sosnowskyi TaxID=360622 RepID=A0AAD8N8A6_9APIA|nr:hypothetical protein POM88_009540 [Heracleum sosnowskyi]
MLREGYRALSKDMIKGGDIQKICSIVEMIVWLLPTERGSVSCNFLLKLLLKAAAVWVDSGEMVKEELTSRIGQQLEEASVNDLLIRNRTGDSTTYDVGIIKRKLDEI